MILSTNFLKYVHSPLWSPELKRQVYYLKDYWQFYKLGWWNFCWNGLRNGKATSNLHFWKIGAEVEITFRSSHPELFLGKAILKICSKFIGEDPCRSAISIKCDFKCMIFGFVKFDRGEFCDVQEQPPRGNPRKSCSENLQQIYRRTPMTKCDFNEPHL